MARWTIDDPGVLALIECPTFRTAPGASARPAPRRWPSRSRPSPATSTAWASTSCSAGSGPMPQGAGRRAPARHLAHGVLARRRLRLRLRRAGPPRRAQARVPPPARHRPALASLGYRPEDFHDDSIYPLLEQPLPGLCADRLDYFFRDSLACGITDRPGEVARFLGPPDRRRDRTIAFDDPTVAREVVARFAGHEPRLVGEPDRGLHLQRVRRRPPRGFRLRRAGPRRPAGRRRPRPEQAPGGQGTGGSRRSSTTSSGSAPRSTEGFRPRRCNPKNRWLDPPVLDGTKLRRVSEFRLIDRAVRAGSNGPGSPQADPDASTRADPSHG